MSLAEVADEFAAALRDQWETEAAIRLVNDPFPLSVRWVAAERGLATDWSALVRLAAGGVGWSAPSASSSWATSPAELAGEGNEIADVLARVPTGRLVILGEPGAGKTILLVRLVLDLLARREPGGPVPVLVPLASWDPLSQDLHDWLSARLIVEHPALMAPAPLASGASRIEALLASNRIVPILDGLDEMPDGTLGFALTGITDALHAGEPLVLSSRRAAYHQALRVMSSGTGTLHGTAVVELCPLQADTVRQYLQPDPGTSARWRPVVAALGADTPVGQALVTPLMVGLARAIYNPRPGEYADRLQDPAELCEPALGDRSAVEQHLFDAFIPAAYRRVPRGARRSRTWTAQQAERWLSFLAQHIEYTIGGSDFAWWHLEDAAPGYVRRMVTGGSAVLSFGVAVAVAAALRLTPPGQLLAGMTAALIVALAVWFGGEPGPVSPMSGLSWSVLRLRHPQLGKRLGAGVAAVVIVPLIGLTVGASPVAGLAWAAMCVLALGLRGVYGDLSVAASPQDTLIRDRRAALFLWFIAGLLLGPAAGLVYGFLTGLALGVAMGNPARLWGLTVGLAVGFASGLGLGIVRSAWPRWEVARGWLTLTGRFPWRLAGFLEDAHRRGVLRQAGAVYQFRHVDLQRRLANRTNGQLE